jgi:hypothetical protein
MLGRRKIDLIPETPAPFASLAEIKATMGIAPLDVSRDVELAARAIAIVEHFETYTDRLLSERTITEVIFEHEGERLVNLAHWPVFAVASVKDASDAIIPPTQYEWDKRTGQLWMIEDGPEFGRKLTVTYTAGFNVLNLPGTLKDAALIQAKHLERAVVTGGINITQETVVDVGSTSYSDPSRSRATGNTNTMGAGVSKEVALLINAYKRKFT